MPLMAFHNTGLMQKLRGEGWGSGGLPLDNFVSATPSRTSENALLEHGMKAAITIGTKELR